MEIPGPEEVPQVAGGDLKELITIVAKEGVKFGRVAVAQLFPQQSVAPLHHTTSL